MKTPKCTFCGAVTEIATYWADPDTSKKLSLPESGEGYFVACTACESGGPVSETKEKAVAAYKGQKVSGKLSDLLKRIIKYNYIVDYPLGCAEPGIVTFDEDYLLILNEITDLVGE